MSDTPDIVYLLWKDHGSFNTVGWKDVEDVQDQLDPFLIESVGYRVRETDEFIVIVPHLSTANGSGCGEMLILKSCILKRINIDIPKIG